MTPKEKAKELLGKMKLQMRGPGIEAGTDNAKRCALIAIDELSQATWKTKTYKHWKLIDVAEFTTREFWEAVKLEIEKM